MIVCTEFFALSSSLLSTFKYADGKFDMFFKTNVLSKIYAGVVEININNDNDNLIFKPIKGDRKFVVMHGNTSMSKSLTRNKQN